jgi:TatD DNase family protein
MYVDSHCHLEIEEFDGDREQVIEQCLAEGLVSILTVGTEERYFDLVARITAQYSQIYGALGIHPHNAGDFSDEVKDRLKTALGGPKMVAVGEIGLDFFRNRSPENAQIKAFEEQIHLAGQLGLPVIIHSRDSYPQTLDVLSQSRRNLSSGGVIHCFSYDLESAKKFLDLGFFISIPGTITYTRNTALQDVVRYVPSDRILSETDAPFLTPQPHRGKRNVPYYVKITVARLAAIRNVDETALATQIHRNFEALFLKGREGVPQ